MSKQNTQVIVEANTKQSSLDEGTQDEERGLFSYLIFIKRQIPRKHQKQKRKRCLSGSIIFINYFIMLTDLSIEHKLSFFMRFHKISLTISFKVERGRELSSLYLNSVIIINFIAGLKSKCWIYVWRILMCVKEIRNKFIGVFCFAKKVFWDDLKNTWKENTIIIVLYKIEFIFLFYYFTSTS